MLQACLNGGLSKEAHPQIPITPLELAASAKAVRAAGADELHIHVRSADGAETLEPTAVADAIVAIRNAVPGMPVGIGTGEWISPGGVERHEHMIKWTERPDYASVNLGEDDAPDVIKLLVEQDVRVEAGLWNQRDAERFVSEVTFSSCLRILVEMTSGDPVAALAEARAVMKVIAQAECMLPLLLHGEGGSVWACLDEAWRLQISGRIGFEDGLQLPDGSLAPDNESLVREAMRRRTLSKLP
ncbi:MAG: 3-keto-5-aminohexanoate cleavage protein [Pseudomonadota bacterium]